VQTVFSCCPFDVCGSNELIKVDVISIEPLKYGEFIYLINIITALQSMANGPALAALMMG